MNVTDKVDCIKCVHAEEGMEGMGCTEYKDLLTEGVVSCTAYKEKESKEVKVNKRTNDLVITVELNGKVLYEYINGCLSDEELEKVINEVKSKIESVIYGG